MAKNSRVEDFDVSFCGGRNASAPGDAAVTCGAEAFLPPQIEGDSSTDVPRPRFFDPLKSVVRSRGGDLPHWHQPRRTCFVTWRTADSLPQEKLDALAAERAEWLREHPEPLNDVDRREYVRLFEGRIQKWLDEGHGACILKDRGLRRVVEEAILKFDRIRYVVYALVVMPNHVHVLFMPLGENSSDELVSAWKGVSAHNVNRNRSAEGVFWQRESWDHLVRNERQFAKFVRYIRHNDPEIAYCAYETEEAGR